ncbi:MAG: sulfurtransferase TusA family protein [Gemmataceae bacterium]
MPEHDHDDRDTQALLSELAKLRGSPCQACARPLCGHEVLLSIALGAKDAPRCLSCLAAVMERTPEALREQITEHLAHRTCYSTAWAAACTDEGQPVSFHPTCLAQVKVRASVASDEPQLRQAPQQEEWDAGHMACGDLVLALRIRLNGMAPRSVLRVTAHDPAAPLDLPAWCGLTGHRLLNADHPVYHIERREK